MARGGGTDRILMAAGAEVEQKAVGESLGVAGK
jgi:hypothetical protein